MDYRTVGLKVGLEIHQQLATHKLFCEDASVLVDAPGGERFRRRLRPTQSELGEVDAAALEEAKRRLTFVYEATPNSCLVEADEEPPHPPNPEALDIALEIALLLDADPVNEVDFMRKIVIDGSNTSGFQRSGLVALDGRLEVNGKRIGVPTILLEEDAARKLGEAEAEVVYRLDRLGIPLVEIATTPNIETPEEAREVALSFGSLLRATRKGTRGLGAYRGRRGNLPFRRAARIRDHSVGTRYRPHSAGARRVGCVRPRRGGGNESPGRVRRDGAPRGRRDPRRSPGDPGPAARRDDGVQPPAPRKGPHVSGDGRAADPRDRGTSSADSRAPPREARRDGREARSGIRDSRAAGPAARPRRERRGVRDDRARVRGGEARRIGPALHVWRASKGRIGRRRNSRGPSAGTLLAAEGRTLRERSIAGTRPGDGAHSLSRVGGDRGSRRDATEPPRSRVDRRRGAASFTGSHRLARGCRRESPHGSGHETRARPRRREVGESGLA